MSQEITFTVNFYFKAIKLSKIIASKHGRIIRTLLELVLSVKLGMPNSGTKRNAGLDTRCLFEVQLQPCRKTGSPMAAFEKIRNGVDGMSLEQ